MRRHVGTLMVLGALTLAIAPASAQVVPPPGAGMRARQGQAAQEQARQELERRLHARFGESLRTRFGLDAAKIQALQQVMQSFQGDRQTLNRAQASLRYRLRDPAIQDLPDAEARSLLQEMVSLQERELALYRREQAELLKVLTPAQLVSFYRLREDLGQRIQELRQGRGLGPGGGIGIGLGEGVSLAPLPGARRGGGGRLR